MNKIQKIEFCNNIRTEKDLDAEEKIPLDNQKPQANYLINIFCSEPAIMLYLSQ